MPVRIAVLERLRCLVGKPDCARSRSQAPCGAGSRVVCRSCSAEQEQQQEHAKSQEGQRDGGPFQGGRRTYAHVDSGSHVPQLVGCGGMVEVAERQEVIVSRAAAVAEANPGCEVRRTGFCLVRKGYSGQERTATFACYCRGTAVDCSALERRFFTSGTRVATMIFARAKISSRKTP